MTASARSVRGVVLAWAMVIGACETCGAPPPSAPVDPSQRARALLAAAVEAHGGARALAELDDLRVTSVAEFREGVHLERSLHYRAPSSLSIAISRDGVEVMSFGIAGAQCWQRHRAFVLPCTDNADVRRMRAVIGARLLHGIDPASVSDAGTVHVGEIDAPALRVDDLVLAFDASSHLVAIDYVDRGERHRESFSDFVSVGGALVARHRSLVIDGVADVSETWTEIVPHGSAPERFVPAEPPSAGDAFDGLDAGRVVVWADLADLDLGADPSEDWLVASHRALDEFARVNGMRESGTEGPILSWRDGGPRVAITIEEVRAFDDVASGPIHVATLPSARYVGVYASGTPDRATGPDADLSAIATRAGRRVVADAPVELLLAPGAVSEPPDARFGLVRVAVER